MEIEMTECSVAFLPQILHSHLNRSAPLLLLTEKLDLFIFYIVIIFHLLILCLGYLINHSYVSMLFLPQN